MNLADASIARSCATSAWPTWPTSCRRCAIPRTCAAPSRPGWPHDRPEGGCRRWRGHVRHRRLRGGHGRDPWKTLCIIAHGTWGIQRVPLAPGRLLNKSIKMNSLFCLPGYFLIEESSPTSASNNDWFADLFADESSRRVSGDGICRGRRNGRVRRVRRAVDPVPAVPLRFKPTTRRPKRVSSVWRVHIRGRRSSVPCSRHRVFPSRAYRTAAVQPRSSRCHSARRAVRRTTGRGRRCSPTRSACRSKSSIRRNSAPRLRHGRSGGLRPVSRSAGGGPAHGAGQGTAGTRLREKECLRPQILAFVRASQALDGL